MKRKWMITYIEGRRTLILAGPIILGYLSHISLSIVDSMMVGRLGTVPLAASSLASSLFSIFMVFGFGLGSCVSVFVSRADGAQQRRDCGEVLRHGLVLGLTAAILLAGLIEILVPFLSQMNQPPEVVALASSYLRILGWSIIPMMIFQSFKSYSEGLSESFWPMVVMFGSVGLNAGLNYLLIFGNFGFPALGLDGAGYATWISRAVMALALWLMVIRSVRFESYLPLKWQGALSWKRMKEMLTIGVPAGFQALFEVGVFSAAAVMMGWIGTVALAAHQIVISIASLTFMVPMGLGFGASIRIGNASGAGHWRAVERIGRSSFILAFFFGVLFSLFFFVSRNWLPRLFVNDLEVIKLAASLFILAGAFQIFDGLQAVAMGALRGLLDVRFPTLASFISYWLLGLPLAYGFAFWFDWQADGIWAGLALALLFAAAFLVSRFLLLARRRAIESSGS
jgi:MATE family multidrug resistance protein